VISFGTQRPPTQMIFVIRDITERKRAKRNCAGPRKLPKPPTAPKHLSDQHEPRAAHPLNAILGFSDLMARDSSLSAEQQENLTIINRSGEHLLSLINNVLDMAKIESGRMVLQHTSLTCTPARQPGRSVPPARRRQRADADRGARAGGAALYTCGRRQVAPGAHQPARQRRQIHRRRRRWLARSCAGLRTRFCQLRFEVQDTGPGIAPEDLEPIFEPFVQSAGGYKSTEGTGLGLPSAASFAR